MERIMYLWDELDDLSAAFRQMTANTADEITSLRVPFAGLTGAVLALWMILGLPA